MPHHTICRAFPSYSKDFLKMKYHSENIVPMLGARYFAVLESVSGTAFCGHFDSSDGSGNDALIEFRIIYLQGKEVGLLPEGHHQSGSAAHPLERDEHGRLTVRRCSGRSWVVHVVSSAT